MADISKIKLPNGSVYSLKDADARGGGSSFNPTSITFGTNTITETAGNDTKVTTFNANGSISEVLTISGNVSTVTTTFNADGSISIAYS